MATTERPTVVIDVVAKWAVDATLYFAMAAGFLLWGVIARSATVNILTFAIMATVAMLVDRLLPMLPDTPALTDPHEAAPDGAVRRTWQRYAVGAAGVMAILCAVYAVLVVYFVPPGFMAGWLTALCVARLRGLATAREIERASHVRLSARLQLSIWRRRTPAYYATPRLGV
ncbi:MAG TPA: hypothetical protein VFL90_18945 [Methylomirabilota bacterium]|nr:hypothetical protein [Methylomirabilota bacterium]